MKISTIFSVSLMMAAFSSIRATPKYRYFMISPDLVNIIDSNNRTDSTDLDDVMVKMLENVANNTAQPCGDFVNYSKGNYFRGGERDTFKALSREYVDSIRDYIEYADWNDNVKGLRSKLDEYKRKCALAHELDLTGFTDGLEKIPTLNWPNLFLALEQEEWTQDFDWTHALGVFRRFGLNNVFFKEQVTWAYNNSDKLIIELGMPTSFTDMLHVSVFDEEYTDEIFQEKKSEFEEFVEKLTKFGKSAENIYNKHGLDFNEVEPKEILKLSQLEQKMPHFNWKKYLSAVLERPLDKEDIEIQLRNPQYIREIVTLLDETSRKELSFYIIMHFMYFYRDIRPYLSSLRAMNNCYLSLTTLFPLGINYLFNQFRESKFENEEALQLIFERLKSQFKKTLQKNRNNLDAKELNYLVEKLDAMNLRVGTTPLDFETEYYNKFYEEAFETNAINTIDNYVHSVLNFRVRKQHEKLFKPPSEREVKYFYAYDEDFEHHFEPFFVPQQNVVIIPQRFLVPPYFSHRFNKVFQYATAGFGIARALVDAFTPRNLIYNAHGNENEIGATISQNMNYKSQIECLLKMSFDYKQKNEILRITDVTGMQLMLDTFFAEIPDTTTAAGLRLSENMRKDYNMKDLFFRYMTEYFPPINNRIKPVLKDAPQLASFYNCTIQTESCTLW